MAVNDLAAAEALVGEELFSAAVFHCHLAAEKLLKALWMETHAQGAPPRTHNLARLAAESDFEEPEWDAFLDDLPDQAVASRYTPRAAYSGQEAAEYLQKTRELWDLLRPRLS